MSEMWAIILGTSIISIIGYLIGGISPAIIIAKIFYKTDIRQHYSGNAGATNAGRVMGSQIGLLILVLDGLKMGLGLVIGKIITILPITNNDQFIFSNASVYLSSIFIIIGHCWPIYHKFKGGKGVGPCIGFFLFLNPIYFVIAITIWITSAALTKIVSLTSIITVIMIFAFSWIFTINNMPINMWINHEEINSQYFLKQFWTPLITAIIALIIILRHTNNIKKLIRGEENKIKVN